MNTVFQRASEARVPLSLELEGDLDPDISAGGGKGVSEQSTAAEHRSCGWHCGGNVKSLPIDGIDSFLCLNYFHPDFCIANSIASCKTLLKCPLLREACVDQFI